ncbi:hypothetical protein CH304_00295 [Rhodococcus sp. 15-649-1-2]|nr:hypothetical protein [Rhodococcus sp. 15-649-1-2]OZE88044.1 hypothetical protein CH304_00295 [Rhodococcus sp. 15-649-1-2]
MTFIVRKKRNNYDSAYDVVDRADTAKVNESGHLTLHTREMGSPVVAVYGPGEWLSAFQAGVVRQSDGDKVYDALTVDALDKGNTKP